MGLLFLFSLLFAALPGHFFSLFAGRSSTKYRMRLHLRFIIVWNYEPFIIVCAGASRLSSRTSVLLPLVNRRSLFTSILPILSTTFACVLGLRDFTFVTILACVIGLLNLHLWRLYPVYLNSEICHCENKDCLSLKSQRVVH